MTREDEMREGMGLSQDHAHAAGDGQGTDSLANSAPRRIQLSRAKGWRIPPNTVRVARPSKWGNPYRIGDTVQKFGGGRVCETIHIRDAETAVALHREWVEFHLEHHADVMVPAIETLRGRHLACWCAPGQPCHADVLLELANRDGEAVVPRPPVNPNAVPRRPT